MVDDPERWLEEWVKTNLITPGHPGKKADMRDAAAQCARDAQGAGLSIQDVKQAAGGDLEVYLLRQCTS